VKLRSPLARNRDITLTTLIDLLVQVVFVFTLILVSAEVIEGDPKDRGWVTPDAWKTLISIFDVDPEKIRGADAQLAEIKGKYEGLKDEARACDAKVGACGKQAGRGPGNSPCLDSAGVEMVVADATIDQRGRITVALRPHSRELQDRQPLGRDAIGTPLSVDQFGSLFRPWREHGLARQPSCAYKAEVTYDPRAPAGSYEPARRAIANYFTLAAPPRRF
jgi:hypothetical protein